MTKDVRSSKIVEANLIMAQLSLQLPRHLYLNLCTMTPPPNFLEITKWDKAQFYDCYVVSDECARRVDILLGPNAKSLFTAWAIQQYETSMEVVYILGAHRRGRIGQ